MMVGDSVALVPFKFILNLHKTYLSDSSATEQLIKEVECDFGWI